MNLIHLTAMTALVACGAAAAELGCVEDNYDAMPSFRQFGGTPT